MGLPQAPARPRARLFKLSRRQRRARSRLASPHGPQAPPPVSSGPHLVVINVAGLDRTGDAVAQSLLLNQPPSVIAVLVNETKIFELDPSIDVPGWSWLPGWEYDPVSTPAQRTMRGQGVFVRDHWSADLSVLHKHPSHLWLELRRRHHQPLAICLVYLPPLGATSPVSLGTDHPRRFTKALFQRTLSLISSEAREFACARPTRQFLLCGDFNAELHPRAVHRTSHGNLWRTFSGTLHSLGIVAVTPVGGFQDTFFANRAGSRVSSSVDHVLVNAASAAQRPVVSISEDLRPTLGNAADHRALLISLPGGDPSPRSGLPLQPLDSMQSNKFRAPETPAEKARLAASVSSLLESSPDLLDAAADPAAASLSQINDNVRRLNELLLKAAESTLTPARRPPSLDHAGHRSSLHRKRFEAAKRVATIGFAIARMRKALSASPDPLHRSRLQSRLALLSTRREAEATVVRNTTRSIKMRRLFKAGTDFETLADRPARQWSNEKSLRKTDRVRTPAQFRDSSGNLATSPADVLRGWARYAKSKSTDSEANSPQISALHARLRALEQIRGDQGPSADELRLLDGPIVLSEITRALRHIRAHAAAGPDGIQPFLLKHGGNSLTLALHNLFNRVWLTESWPSNWCEGIITYIVKSGPGRVPSNPADHRPITLLSVIAKCFERILHYRLQSWCESRSRISDTQNGFRPGRNTDDNLLFLTETLRSRLSRGQSTVLIFYDVAAAYDQVDRLLLFHSLGSQAQCRGRFYNMIKAILAKVKRQVAIDRSLSEQFDLDMGVPQGSVLSPILFNLTINPIVRCLASGPFNATTIFGDGALSASAFADDLLSILDDPDDIQAELDRVGSAADAHRVHFSASKTQVVLVTSDGQAKEAFSLRSWSLQGQIILAAPEYRYHGVYVGMVRPIKASGGDCDQPAPFALDWSSSLKEKSVSFRRRMSSLFRAHCSPSGLSLAATATIYCQELRPILDYACAIMDLLPREVKLVRNLQNQALRLFLYGSTDKSRFSEWLLCNELGILPWHHRRAELQLRFFGRLVDLRSADHGSRRTKFVIESFHRRFQRWSCRLRDGSFRDLRCPALAILRPDWRLWRDSIFRIWCDTHRTYGLAPSWTLDDADGGIPRPISDGPAAPAWAVARAFRPPSLGGNDADAAPPSALDIRTRVIRGAVLATAQLAWEPSRVALSRQRDVGADHLGNGFTRRAIPRDCGHRVGRLVLRVARSGALPLRTELRRIDKSSSTRCPMCSLADESIHHFAFHCPAYTGPRSLLRDAASRLLPIGLLRTFSDPTTPLASRFALISDPGFALWPSFFPIPPWARRHALPPLARGLAQLPRSQRLAWYQACTNFFARAWRIRCIALFQAPLASRRPPNDALMIAALRSRSNYPRLCQDGSP